MIPQGSSLSRENESLVSLLAAPEIYFMSGKIEPKLAPSKAANLSLICSCHFFDRVSCRWFSALKRSGLVNKTHAQLFAK